MRHLLVKVNVELYDLLCQIWPRAIRSSYFKSGKAFNNNRTMSITLYLVRAKENGEV